MQLLQMLPTFHRFKQVVRISDLSPDSQRDSDTANKLFRRSSWAPETQEDCLGVGLLAHWQALRDREAGKLLG